MLRKHLLNYTTFKLIQVRAEDKNGSTFKIPWSLPDKTPYAGADGNCHAVWETTCSMKGKLKVTSYLLKGQGILCALGWSDHHRHQGSC